MPLHLTAKARAYRSPNARVRIRSQSILEVALATQDPKAIKGKTLHYIRISSQRSLTRPHSQKVCKESFLFCNRSPNISNLIILYKLKCKKKRNRTLYPPTPLPDPFQKQTQKCLMEVPQGSSSVSGSPPHTAYIPAVTPTPI